MIMVLSIEYEEAKYGTIDMDHIRLVRRCLVGRLETRDREPRPLKMALEIWLLSIERGRPSLEPYVWTSPIRMDLIRLVRRYLAGRLENQVRRSWRHEVRVCGEAKLEYD